VRCPGQRKLAQNLGQGWVKPDAAVRMRRTLERAQPMLMSSRTESDTRGPFASARWRCPNHPWRGIIIPFLFQPKQDLLYSKAEFGSTSPQQSKN
jgi:hypothetical protein